MNINSIISNIPPSVRGFIPDRPARASSSSAPIVDSFVRSVDDKNRVISYGYTRATASGSALRQSASPGDVGKAARGSAADDNATAVAEPGKESPRSDSLGPKNIQGQPLNSSEVELLAQLRHINQAVRTHEMAHLAAAGGYARGGASYTYKRGPDGRSYAVGGEVRIDTSPAGTPEMTMAKMRVIRQAALAPADPSSQDQLVAAQASAQIAKAAQELAQLANQVQSANKPAVRNVSAATGTPNTTPGAIYSQTAAVRGRPESPSLNAYNRLRSYGAQTPNHPTNSQRLNIIA